MSTFISPLSDYFSLEDKISHKDLSSDMVIDILKEELSSILSAQKIQARDTISRLNMFERYVVRPYMDAYLQHHTHDIAESFTSIKKLQAIKEQIMNEKRVLEHHLFNKKINAVVKSKSVLRIESLLVYLEELFRLDDFSSSRKTILEQVKICIPHLSQNKQAIRKEKFDI